MKPIQREGNVYGIKLPALLPIRDHVLSMITCSQTDWRANNSIQGTLSARNRCVHVVRKFLSCFKPPPIQSLKGVLFPGAELYNNVSLTFNSATGLLFFYCGPNS